MVVDFTQVYQNFITAFALDSDRVGSGVYKFDSIDLRELPVNATGQTNVEKRLISRRL